MQDARKGPARWADAKSEVEIHSSSINHELKAKDVQHPYIAFLEKVRQLALNLLHLQNASLKKNSNRRSVKSHANRMPS